MNRRPSSRNLVEVAALFTRLGFTAFGGPAAHLALIENEVVHRRKWLDRQHFIDLIALINFIPGPNSTELVIHLGYLRAGWPGLFIAGLCFILPAVTMILPLAWVYVTYGGLPRMQDLLVGVNAAVIAIIAVAMFRFSRTAIKDRFTGVLAALAVVASLLLRHLPQVQPELIILAVCGIAGAARHAPRWKSVRMFSIAPLPLAVSLDLTPNLARMAFFFLKVGATLFGSGYVLVSFLKGGLVEQYGWLSEPELLTAITVGQVTPGPLLTSATFIGYVLGSNKFGGGVAGGIAGALLATLAIFLPSFCLVAALGRTLDRIRQSPRVRGALDGLNAAVVALIFVVTLDLAQSALRDPLSIALAAGSCAALLFWNINATWIILVAGAFGVAAHALA